MCLLCENAIIIKKLSNLCMLIKLSHEWINHEFIYKILKSEAVNWDCAN